MLMGEGWTGHGRDEDNPLILSEVLRSALADGLTFVFRQEAEVANSATVGEVQAETPARNHLPLKSEQ